MIPLVLGAFLGSAHAAGFTPGLEALGGVGYAWGAFSMSDPGVSSTERAWPIAFEARFAPMLAPGDEGFAFKFLTGLDFATGPSHASNPPAGQDFYFRYRFTGGVGAGLHTESFDAWVLGGGLVGLDTVDGTITNGAGKQAAWFVEIGSRLGPASLLVSVPIGHGDRLLLVRSVVKVSEALGAGLEFERVHERQRDDTFTANRVVALFGLAY